MGIERVHEEWVSGMDEVVRKVAALGLPGIILVVTMATTGLAGAAAIRLLRYLGLR